MKKRRYVVKFRVKSILVLLFLVYLLGIFAKQEMLLREQYVETRELERQIDYIRQENNDLVRQIQYSESEEYIERVARENLGWVKEGERILIEDKK
ncbi:MAG: hypothetical protein GX974_04275 [Clostridiales bacterium]|nr:hypothetical protein [Clostridiales bacterium]